MAKENSALDGLRIIDLANELGAYCGKLLVGMGAEVIKVERPGGECTRNLGPFFRDDPHPEKSLYFAYINTGKQSITLNLETRDGQAIFKKLIKDVDIIIETFPVDYLAKLGLDYQSLKAINPRLVMTSITPFGQTGSHKNYQASSEIIPVAMSGLMFMTGEPSAPPLQVGNYLVGYGAGIYAALGTLAAIHNRDFTGEGEHVDISLQDTAASCLEACYVRYQLANGKITSRFGSQLPSIVPSGIFPCKDGYYCVVGVGRWNLIAAWLVSEGIDVGDLVDPKYETMDGIKLVDHRERINGFMIELGKKYTKEELMLQAQERGIPITGVGNAQDVYTDKQLNARDYFINIKHPVLGELKYPGAPYKMTGSPWKIDKPAPLVGEHNQEVYQSLGYSPEDLVTLKASGVI